MTKQEFLEYILSFNRKQGEYTDDEIYEISKKHRSLVLNERNWNELADLLGLEKSGEQLRTWTIMKLKQNDEFVSNSYPGTIAKSVSENSAEMSESLKQQVEQLMVQRQELRETYNAYTRKLKENTKTNMFKNELLDAIDKLPSLPTISYDDIGGLDNREAILMLSDLHIGVQCDNFYNKYNLDIATRRIEKVVDDTIYYCHNNDVETLNVINLGDMIHGIIHTSARLEQQMIVTEQIIQASELLANALNKLQMAAPNVIYRSVVDNHSRAVANKEENLESENFNKIIDWFIQERLKHTHIVFKLEENLDDGLGMFQLGNGKSVVFAHGHQDNINSSFQSFIGATRQFIDYGLLAHYHSAKMKSFNDFTVFVNGSVCGTEQYALSKRLFSKPQQTLLIFNENDDSIMNISIMLNSIN